MEAMVRLEPVDAVEVTVVVDNVVDVTIAGQEGVRRLPLRFDPPEREQLVADGGFAAVVTVERGGTRSSILYDGGLSRQGLVHNMDVMELRPRDLRALAISHGHPDHHGGLEGVFSRHGRLALPLVIHPEAWRDRRIVLPTGAELHLPPPSRGDLEREGVEVVEERGPSLLLDGCLLVSGRVSRETAFETGFPVHQARTATGWEPDPVIDDDQNVVVNVRDAGLVIVSGCSHAGAVNVCLNARKVTGVEAVAGLIGGLHLSGPIFEPIIDLTVDALSHLGVGRIVPCHCTGWKAVHRLAAALPDAFVQPSVGTVYRFGAP